MACSPSPRRRSLPARHLCRLPATIALAAVGAAAGAAELPDSAAAPAMLSEIQVVGDAGDDGTTTEGTESYTPRATRAGTGLVLSPRENPQSVTVITRQRIEDQNMRSLTDVMASTPGISVRNLDSERYSFSSRGFSVDNYLYDGIPTSFDSGYDAGESSLDPIIYDRIEVVRGATGLVTGAGNPAAAVNLVRKRADSKTLRANVSASAGSWDDYRATADLATPLTADGRLRGRVVAAYQDSGSYRQGYGTQKQVFYGVIDADLTPRTTLSAGFNYQDNDPHGSTWGGFPLWYADGGRTDWTRSVTTGADWTSWSSTNTGAFLDLDHRFANGWRLDALLNHSKSEADAKLLYLTGWPDRDSGLGMSASPAYYLGDRKQNSVDLKLSGPVELFGREHELVFGLSRSRHYADFDYRSPVGPAPMGSFLGWDGSYPEPAWNDTTASAMRSTTKQTGFYGAARIALAAPLKLIVGARYTKWETDAVGWAGSARYKFDKDEVTPYAGLLYDINDTYTAYASYTSIFKPQSSRDRNGGWLDPLEGNSYEAGIKGEFLNGRLNASAAVFQIEQDNLAQADPGHLVPGTTDQAYYAAQGTRSRGYDLELSGELAPGWNAIAGLSHWTARDGDGAAVQTDQPRTLLRLFTTYRLPGQWHRLTVGGGVNWQSRAYTIASGPNGEERVEQGSYAVVSLMARYRLNRHLSAQINVNNLFDKAYYDQIGFYSQGAWGMPRSVVATVSYQY